MRCEPRVALAGVLVAGALAAGPAAAPARAEIVDATSTTLLVGRADPRDGVVHTAVPLYQMISLRASDLALRGVDDLSLVVSGWGAVVLADPLDDKHAFGDLDIAFAEGKLLRRRLTVRLGRQLLVAGAGRNLGFDGLSVTARPCRWAGLSAQAGVPVTPRFAVDRGDALVAGRIFVQPAFDSAAGVSVLQVLDHGEIARRDLALDARVVPVRSLPLALNGFALWSIPERRLAEGTAGAAYQVGRHVEVTGDYRRTAPDLFLARSSIFSVFSQESRDEVGGYLYLRLPRRLRLQGDYHVIVDASGTGHDASAKLTGAFGPDGRSTAGVESRRLALPHTGYLLARAFAQARVATPLVATVDASSFFFDADVNGHRQSFVAAATLGYDLHPGWRVVVTGLGSVTPFVERRLEGMARLIYQRTYQARQVTGQGGP